MTYREAFDQTGRPRKNMALRRHYRHLLVRWLAIVCGLLAWAHLVGYLDGNP